MAQVHPDFLNPPVHSALKDLHLATDLVRDGRPAVTIVHGVGLTRVGVAETTLLASETPIDVDWNFGTGTVQVVTSRRTELRLALADPGSLCLGHEAAPESGRIVPIRRGSETLPPLCRNAATAGPSRGNLTALTLPAGRHVLTGATPAPAVLERVAGRLTALLAQAEAERARLVVGCEDGTVLALDDAGQSVATARVAGVPTLIAGTADRAVVATDRGEVRAFGVAAAEG